MAAKTSLAPSIKVRKPVYKPPLNEAAQTHRAWNELFDSPSPGLKQSMLEYFEPQVEEGIPKVWIEEDDFESSLIKWEVGDEEDEHLGQSLQAGEEKEVELEITSRSEGVMVSGIKEDKLLIREVPTGGEVMQPYPKQIATTPKDDLATSGGVVVQENVQNPVVIPKDGIKTTSNGSKFEKLRNVKEEARMQKYISTAPGRAGGAEVSDPASKTPSHRLDEGLDSQEKATGDRECFVQ
ncbi:hypothetical protein QJS10_CPA08g01114 [Acorus calamus]|uniref:Uncharacterized protein n=1 Tax=Acorus calamus TaxID=4465 RepID=A0AAV9ECR5_ACOCL|nr:hypothetical protein QJS10_CPA08g01114 [Acorus calamus]